jgi:hypothetical protein
LSGVIGVRMMSPDLIAALTVPMNSSSCVASLNETKCAPM